MRALFKKKKKKKNESKLSLWLTFGVYGTEDCATAGRSTNQGLALAEQVEVLHLAGLGSCERNESFRMSTISWWIDREIGDLLVNEWRREAMKQGPGEADELRQPSDMDSDEPKLSDDWSMTSRRACDCISLSVSEDPKMNFE
jgi:hypothetical protein